MKGNTMFLLPLRNFTQLVTKVKQWPFGSVSWRRLSILLGLPLLGIVPITSVAAAPTLSYSVVAEHTHDRALFTQGLEIRDGKLYESSGRVGSSRVVVSSLRSPSAVLQQWALPNNVFGEGLSFAADSLFVLTWKSGRVFRLNPQLQPVQELHLPREGWGAAYSQPWGGLVLSDGSAILEVRRPDDFGKLKEVVVKSEGRYIEELNELESVGQSILANLWHDSRVAVIGPSGEVSAWLDTEALWARAESLNGAALDPEAVPNGLALDPKTGHLFMTGKLWPVMFELDVPALRKLH
jgi:glutamine cyclotransferase